MTFATWILRKFDMKILQIGPSHLSDVATLPWKIKKKSFSTVLFIHTSDYLGLRYLRRKQTVVHLPTPPANGTTLTCELQNFFHLIEGLLRSFKRWKLRRASCGLWSEAAKRTGCDVWQLECQASNVTASVQSDQLLHASNLFRHRSVA